MDEVKSAARLLGVRTNASDREVKAAFRALAKSHHPDVGGDTQLFAAICGAYERLRATQPLGESAPENAARFSTVKPGQRRPTFADHLRSQLGYM
jgi:curved DNA-binding protein CbpA